MSDNVQQILLELSSSKLQQLLSIKNSPRYGLLSSTYRPATAYWISLVSFFNESGFSRRYLERLSQKIEAIREEAEKMEASARLMSLRFGEADTEIVGIYPRIDLIRDKTKVLKKKVTITHSSPHTDICMTLVCCNNLVILPKVVDTTGGINGIFRTTIFLSNFFFIIMFVFILFDDIT
jgi:hypothetical protein